MWDGLSARTLLGVKEKHLNNKDERDSVTTFKVHSHASSSLRLCCSVFDPVKVK